MRFGGHQTFSIREGWLYKGLRVLQEAPESFGTETLRDRLGVGKNMAKAVHHWLLAARLAQPTAASRRNSPLELTAFGRAVWEHDRYFLEPGTWWLIHTELVHNPAYAFSWYWFFNHFTASRFEKGVVVEGLKRYLQNSGSRVPADRTLDRDVSCLLKTYAEEVPRPETDPEDLLECPMIELGLLRLTRQSGFYHLNTGRKEIPFPVFGYVVARAFDGPEDGGSIDLSLTELAQRENGPGRLFALSSESLFEMLVGYQDDGEDRLSVSSQAGERIVRFESRPPGAWLEEFLASVESEPTAAVS